MNRIHNPNSWYGWSDLQGNWGSLSFGGFINSNIGIIQLPVVNGIKDNVLYLAGGNYKGKFLMGGQSQNGHGTWFYTDGQWWNLSPASHGMIPSAFNQDGSIFYSVINDTQALTRDNITGPLGTVNELFYVDGIRAVVLPGNTIIRGNNTKYSEKFNLYEYIQFSDDVAVGQGGANGLVIYYKGTSYQIEPGGTYFIKAMFDGTTFALATVKQEELSCVHWWLTVDELSQFPVIGEDDIVAIGKPLYLGWFEFNNPPTANPPGNAITAIRFPNESNTIRLFNGAQFATWIDGQSVAEINARVAACPTPALAYWDGRNWPEWPILRENDFIGCFGYCYRDETMQVFEANLQALIDRIPFHFQNIAVICQCFTSNDSLTTNLKGLVPVYARIAQRNPRVTFLNVFSDQGRATGLNDHPEVRPYWEKLAAGITGVPNMDNGVVNGVLIDPEKYFFSLVAGKNPADYERVMREIENDLYKYGLGQQCDSGCTPRARLFLPTAACRNASPSPSELCLGVKQQATCWDHAVDVSDGVSWAWVDRGGPPYVPLDPTPVPPSDVAVFIQYHDTLVRRSDPNGLLIRFEAASDLAITEVTLGLNDGEQPIPIMFKNEPRIDGRYVRALAFKPTINGTFTLTVRAKNSDGKWGEKVSPTPVTVIE